MHQSLIKGNEIRYGKAIYLDGLSKELMGSLSEHPVSEAMLGQDHDRNKAIFPISPQEIATWYKEQGELTFAIRLQNDHTCIGVCRFGEIAWQGRHAQLQLSFFDDSNYQSELVGDTLQTCLQFAYWEANLNRIYLYCGAEQSILKLALEAQNFTHEGTLRQDVYRHGRYLDTHLYSILAREWQG